MSEDYKKIYYELNTFWEEIYHNSYFEEDLLYFDHFPDEDDFDCYKDDEDNKILCNKDYVTNVIKHFEIACNMYTPNLDCSPMYVYTKYYTYFGNDVITMGFKNQLNDRCLEFSFNDRYIDSNLRLNIKTTAYLSLISYNFMPIVEADNLVKLIHNNALYYYKNYKKEFINILKQCLKEQQESEKKLGYIYDPYATPADMLCSYIKDFKVILKDILTFKEILELSNIESWFIEDIYEDKLGEYKNTDKLVEVITFLRGENIITEDEFDKIYLDAML